MKKTIKNTIEDTIEKTISKVAESFDKDELAYLALTSKVESPVQDKWAFLLHKELFPKYLVAREWKRVDIAILDGKTPKALIELSAMYTCDAFLSYSNEIIKKLKRDEKNAEKLFPECKNIYTVLLMTHPYSHFPKKLTPLKYEPIVNAAYNKGKMRENIEPTEAKEEMDKRLNRKSIIKTGELKSGVAFDIKTSIFYWIIKAKRQ